MLTSDRKRILLDFVLSIVKEYASGLYPWAHPKPTEVYPACIHLDVPTGVPKYYCDQIGNIISLCGIKWSMSLNPSVKKGRFLAVVMYRCHEYSGYYVGRTHEILLEV